MDTTKVNLENNKTFEIKSQNDTLKYYYDLDRNVIEFDTLFNSVSYHMIFYCLNDSSVYNPTCTSDSQGNQIEYSVAHNYSAEYFIKRIDSDNIVKVKVSKEDFRNLLPEGFTKICHMWNNQFEKVENNMIIFRATLAQPDTDYQYSVLYTIDDEGVMKIIDIIDESCCDD